jgi:hypothetical protein
MNSSEVGVRSPLHRYKLCCVERHDAWTTSSLVALMYFISLLTETLRQSVGVKGLVPKCRYAVNNHAVYALLVYLKGSVVPLMLKIAVRNKLESLQYNDIIHTMFMNDDF